MKIWNKFTVGTKIFFGFLIVLAITAIFGAITYFQTYRADADVTNLADDLAQSQHAADEIDANIWKLRFYAAQYIALEDQSILVNYKEEYDKFQTLLDEATEKIKHPKEAAILQEIHSLDNEFNDSLISIGDIIFRRHTIVNDTLEPQGATAIENLQKIRRAAYNNGEALATYYSGNASEYMQLAQAVAAKYIDTGNEKYLTQFRQRYEQTINALGRLEKELKDPERKKMASAAVAAFEDYTQTLEGLKDDYAAQKALVTKMNITGLTISDKAEAITVSIAEEFQTQLDTTHENSAKNRVFILTTVLSTLLVGLGLAWGITRGITRPIKTVTEASVQLAEGKIPDIKHSDSRDELGTMTNAFGRMVGYLNGMADIARAIANGDLSVEVMPYSDEDLLGHALAKMVESMRNVVGRVQTTALQIADASEQLAHNAAGSGQAADQVTSTLQQVAQGTAQQAEGMTKATNTVEQVSRAINGVAQGAQEQAEAAGRTATLTMQVAEIVRQVAVSAETGAEGSVASIQTASAGAETIRQAVQNMETIRDAVELIGSRVQEVSDRSNKIGAIVETIDDIAAQTNLLALNAAIEAARAGEHGKGFAVVADEVRKLAEKSAAATGEIANLIKGIQSVAADTAQATTNGVKAVAAGVEQIDHSGAALDSIVSSAETVNKLMADIAAAAEQMSGASDELVSAMETVSAVIEENTASTEEMAASSNEVIEVIETIASISEENSAAVEEVSAAAEEMNAQMGEVAGAAQELDAMAKELQQVIAIFKLEADDALNGNGHNAAETDDAPADETEETATSVVDF